MILRVDLPHGGLSMLLFMRVRNESRHPRDDKHRVSELVGKTQIAADGCNRPVDVDRQRMLRALGSWLPRAINRADHADMTARQLQLQRRLEQAGRTWIPRVKAVTETRRRCALAETALDDFSSGLVQRLAGPHER